MHHSSLTGGGVKQNLNLHSAAHQTNMAHHAPGHHILSALAGQNQDGVAGSDVSNEEWRLSKGIPKPSDATVQDHMKKREEMIQHETKQRSAPDATFRENLSPIAQKACAIVKAVRSKEEVTIWGEDPKNHTTTQKTEDGHSLYPGMMFALAQKRIEQSKLYAIIRKMPKGALLHCHIEAMVNYQWLFQHVLTVPGIHVSASCPILSPDDQAKVNVNFTHLKNNQTGQDSLCVPSYVPNTWIPVTDAARTFTGGGAAFVNFIVSKCSISVEDSLNHREGPNAIWTKFQNCFNVVSPVVYYEPIYRAHLAHFFNDLADDNISYVEIRQPSIMQFTLDGQEKPLSPEEGWRASFRIIAEEVQKFKASAKGKDFWGVKIVWNTIRIFPDKDIYASMQGAIALKQEFPDLIAGFDLVGQEDMGRTLVDLLPMLLWFKDACSKAKVNIPLLLHAGETNQSGGTTDLNLFDAVLLGSRRIGHGYSLFKHPSLMEMVRDRQIMIEMCPISNEVLRLNTSTYGHPLSALVAHGVSCAISNDDPGVLGVNNAGLSFDLFQAIQGAESLGLEGLGALAENSIRWSVFEDEDDETWLKNVNSDGQDGKGGIKAQRLQMWRSRWEEFCHWVVDEAHKELDDCQEKTIEELKAELLVMTNERDRIKKAYDDLQKKLKPRFKNYLTAVHRANYEDEMYFLKNTDYVRVDVITDAWTGGGVIPVLKWWIGLRNTGWASVDSFLPISSSNSAYCFRGSQYIKYNIQNDTISEGPAPWAQRWPALDAAGFTQIDATLPYIFLRPKDGHAAWFFQNEKCIQLDVETGRVVSAVGDTLAKFPCLADTGITHVDMAFLHPKTEARQAWFFGGSCCVLADLVGGKLVKAPSDIGSTFTALRKAYFY